MARLEAQVTDFDDRRASRIPPLLEGARRRERPPDPGRSRSQRRDPVEEAMNRYAEQRARREARRRARHEARQARRRERIRNGFPFPLSLLFGLAFAVGIVAVTVTTQLVVPLVLTILSIFVARGALRRASTNVREAGRSALDNMERSRRWFHGEAPPAAHEPQVRVEPEEHAGGMRVADEQDEREENADEDEAQGRTGRRS